MTIIAKQDILKFGVTVRDMLDSDLSTVVKIEQIAQISPWSRLSFEEALSNHYHCRVLCCRGQVLAYHICSSVLDELQLLNVVVSPSAQGLGLGHRLLQDVLDSAAQLRCDRIFLEVRMSNYKAQSLYRQWQFEQIGVRKQYYSTPSTEREDALIFVRRLAV